MDSWNGRLGQRSTAPAILIRASLKLGSELSQKAGKGIDRQERQTRKRTTQSRRSRRFTGPRAGSGRCFQILWPSALAALLFLLHFVLHYYISSFLVLYHMPQGTMTKDLAICVEGSTNVTLDEHFVVTEKLLDAIAQNLKVITHN